MILNKPNEEGGTRITKRGVENTKSGKKKRTKLRLRESGGWTNK